ncbi:MAG: O-antigen ligase family protein [Microthrixaceae bacterium]
MPTTELRPLTAGTLDEGRDTPPWLRLSVWMLPTFAAVGGVTISIDVGPVPMYPFKALVPLLAIAVAFTLRRSVRMSAEVLILFALSVWTLGGLFWGDSDGVLQLFSVVVFAALLVASLRMCGHDIRQDLVTGWRAALVVTGLVSVWELLTGQHLATAFVTSREGFVSGVVLSVFNNPNDYGAFIALAVPLSLLQFGQRKRPVWLLPLTLASIAFLVVGASRFALLALVLSAGVVAFRLRQRWWVPPAAWVSAVGVASGVLVLLAIGAKVIEKFLALTSSGALGDTSAGVRVALIGNGLWGGLTTGGVGLGGGGFETMIESGDAPIVVRDGVVNPHNFWIETFSELGVVGVACILGLLIVFARRLSVGRLGDLNTAILWGAMVGYLLAASTPSSYLASPVNWMFLASLAVFTAEAPIGRASPINEGANSGTVNRLKIATPSALPPNGERVSSLPLAEDVAQSSASR